MVRANIFLEDPRWPWSVSTVAATTDESGRFTAKALDGTRYRIHAVSHVANGPASAEPVTVEPVGSTAKLTLVLSRKGHTPSEQTGTGLESWRNGLGLR